VAVSGIERADAAGSVFTVQTTGHCYRAEMSLGGVYNIYNALAAVTVAHGVGVPIGTALRSLEAAKPAFGRVEEVDWDGRLLQLILVKNPAGFTQVLDTFLRSRTEMNILIAVNDLEADGRDVSWLWDVPFECLAGRRHNIIAAGTWRTRCGTAPRPGREPGRGVGTMPMNRSRCCRRRVGQATGSSRWTGPAGRPS